MHSPAESDPNAPLEVIHLDTAPTASTSSFVWPQMVAIGLVAVLSLGVVFVFWGLPHWTQTSNEPTASASSSEGQAPATSAPQSPSALIPEPPQARQSAQDTLALLLPLVDALRAQHAEDWATQDFKAITTTVATGEQAYREQRFTAARQAYAEATSRIEKLQARVPDIVNDYLDQGQRALMSQDARAANAAYSRALALDPKNVAAERGMARADSFDKVVALIAEAQGYERVHDTANAARAYHEALKRDPDAAEARQALARLEAEHTDEVVTEAMSRGFKALDAQDYSAATTAFENALKLKPKSREAVNALAQTKTRATAARLEATLRAAQLAVRAENWREAAAQFRAALAIDSGLADADLGVKQAERRANLDSRLVSVLATPERLSDESAATAADALLAEANSIAAPGPRLHQQMTTLKAALANARIAIPVTIHSDDATDVTILRIGQLGAFDSHTVSLHPGHYVAVGKRVGYRDVRIEFTVAANAAPPSLAVQCDEAIAFGR